MDCRQEASCWGEKRCMVVSRRVTDLWNRSLHTSKSSATELGALPEAEMSELVLVVVGVGGVTGLLAPGVEGAGREARMLLASDWMDGAAAALSFCVLLLACAGGVGVAGGSVVVAVWVVGEEVEVGLRWRRAMMRGSCCSRSVAPLGVRGMYPGRAYLSSLGVTASRISFRNFRTGRTCRVSGL